MQMKADVIVIGAGPSGLTVAAEVASAGHRVVILERRTDVVESRAGTLLPRVLELFDCRGIADRFVRKAREIRHWPFNPYHIWAGLQPVEWRHIESRYGFTLLMPQNLTEQVLKDWAQEKGVDVRMGHEVLQVAQNETEAWVVARDESGEELRVTGRYLVGADGARSIVRNGLLIPFEGHPPTFTGIIADASMDFPFPSGLKMIGNHLGWAACYPFGERVVRFVIVHALRMSADRNEPVTLEEFTACVRDIYGTDFGIEGLTWASRYTDQLRIVPKFRKGRSFLVGESARIHYPSSGVGMNFCIQDAFNLGWKLSYVLSGQAPEVLLDTYDTERRPVALGLLDSVRSQCAIQFNFTEEGMTHKRDLETRFLPIPEFNRKVGLELNGIGAPYPRAPDDHPLVGFRVKDLSLIQLDGTVARLSEMLRDQRFLLLDFTGLAALAPLGAAKGPLKVVEARGVMLPPAESALQALLVRPDGYVAWATNSAPDRAQAFKAVERACGVAEVLQ
jgi:2-polyprenyl-6-methoxyphenol hydroxylase-like FAD-dependent oxidoreductase